MNFTIIIPARYASTRLPGKPLVDINGKPMILHVIEKSQESKAERIIVATEHEKIANIAKTSGVESCLTSTNHKSGTERLAEVVDKYCLNDETIIVNIQGDEPTITADSIRQVVKNLINKKAEVVTLAVKISNIKEIINPNIVKLIIDNKGYALYFSRAAIPWFSGKKRSIKNKIISSNNNIFFRHIGIYGYRASFVRKYITWHPSPLEKIEKLEQLRILWYGEKIYVPVIKNLQVISVDTTYDLKRVRIKFSSNNET